MSLECDSEQPVKKSMNLVERLKGFLLVVPLVVLLMSTYPSRILLCALILVFITDEYARVSGILSFGPSQAWGHTVVHILRVELAVCACVLCVAGHFSHVCLVGGYIVCQCYVFVKYLFYSSTYAPLNVHAPVSGDSLTMVPDRALSAPPSPALFAHLCTISFGLTWLLLLCGHVACLHSLSHGLSLVLLAIVTTAAGENGGLFGGFYAGRSVPFPRISPGKTLEGFVCQVGTSVVTAVVYCYCTQLATHISHSHSVVIGTCIGVLAIVGDLFESLFKRCFQTKDAATMIPGWGGLLDRMDGLVLVFPFLFYYTYAFLPALI